MSVWGTLVFGQVTFEEHEELAAFRFRFLAIVMFSGAVLTGLLILGDWSGANPIAGQHMISMQIFTCMATLFWLLLRNHRERFLPVAWGYEALCLMEYTSALMYVPQDELRVLWFLVNIPGVYILLGRRAGGAIAIASIFGLAGINGHLSAPYSANAMATLLLGIAYMAVIFHFYADRSISFFLRMQASNTQLRFMASHDTLTGVLNARAYYAAADQFIRVARRSQAPYAVLFIDLDHFKRINDQHGHSAGDAVLKGVADCLARNIRDSDFLGRIGGEEFSIFLPHTEITGACKLAENLRQRIELLMPVVDGQLLRVTASIGVAGDDVARSSMQGIQQRADQAMYEAKAQGRNRVSCFSDQGNIQREAA